MTGQPNSIDLDRRRARRIADGAMMTTRAIEAVLRNRAPVRGATGSSGFPRLQKKGTSHVSTRC